MDRFILFAGKKINKKIINIYIIYKSFVLMF